MTLFSRLRQRGTEVPWGTFARVVAESLGTQTEAAVEVVAQLREWGVHLTTNALSKWGTSISSPARCSSPAVPMPGKICGEHAVVRCDVCDEPRCLAHARVDYLADAICDACIGRAKAWQRVAAKKAEPPPPPAYRMTAAQALIVLGLGQRAPWPEIKRRYHQLVLKHNADRPQTDASRARNTRRLQKLNAAFEVLRARFEEGEAAA